MPHPVIHFEFLVSDSTKSKEFYEKLFGWEMNHNEELNYTLINTGTDPGGGMFQVSGDMPKGLILYVDCDDIAAKLKEAEDGGGTIIHPETHIHENVGWSGIFADPWGNKIGLFKGAQNHGAKAEEK